MQHEACHQNADTGYMFVHEPLGLGVAVHTMAELKLSGNHLKGSRPVLSFHAVGPSLPSSTHPCHSGVTEHACRRASGVFRVQVSGSVSACASAYVCMHPSGHVLVSVRTCVRKCVYVSVWVCVCGVGDGVHSFHVQCFVWLHMWNMYLLLSACDSLRQCGLRSRMSPWTTQNHRPGAPSGWGRILRLPASLAKSQRDCVSACRSRAKPGPRV
jgi:hypothetical protein